MPLTIGQYALDRGYSRTAIYKAIDRLPELQSMTYKGINKGKETIFISDEGIELLDSTLQPSQKANDALKKNLELAIRDRESELIREKAEKIEELTNKFTTLSEALHQEKEQEMTVTRKEMITRVEAVGSEVSEALSIIKNSYEVNLQELKDKISKLEAENEALKAENKRLSEVYNRLKTSCKQLTNSIKFAHNHPVRFLISGKDQQLPEEEI